MRNAILGALVAILLLGGAYRLGQNTPVLEAQGRGPVIPPKPRSDAKTKPPEPLVFSGDSGSVAQAAENGFMAVTGSYGVGTSVLYLIDTRSQQLLVYEARGGSQSMRRIVLVGARRIDLDLKLIDYNDESEYRRKDLERLFQGGPNRPRPSGVTVPGDLDSALGTGEYEERTSGAVRKDKSERR